MIPIDGERTPLVRTDFSDDHAWESVIDAVSKPSVHGFLANLNPVNDHRYDNADPVELAKEADSSTDLTLLIVADSRTMSEPQMPLLCVDPIPPGGQFRMGAHCERRFQPLQQPEQYSGGHEGFTELPGWDSCDRCRRCALSLRDPYP